MLCSPTGLIRLNMQSKKFLKPEFCGKTSMAICAIFDDRRCEKGPLRAEVIFARKRFILKNFEKPRLSR